MTITRISKPMKNSDIKKVAQQHGYKYTGYSTWKCDACNEEMLKILKAAGFTNTVPSWVNVYHALKFRKKDSIIVACQCGWRKDITPKKRYCSTKGCNVVLNNNDKHTICFKCRKDKATSSAPTTKICNRIGCNNPVPVDRVAVCYDCIPKTK